MAGANARKNRSRWRVWQQRFVQLLLLFSIATVVSLAWTVVAAEDRGFVVNVTQASTGQFEGASPTPGDSRSNKSTSSEKQSPAETSLTTQTEASGTTASRTPRPSEEDEIPVYLVGAVARPGVYIIRKGTYLYELVERAGGLTQDAADTTVNLAMRINENQMIRIPSQGETDHGSSAGVEIIGGGVVVNDPSSAKININRATQADLEKLPGVGPATAAAIIADRDKNGPFRQIEDIMRVPGIKESRFVLMEALISVG